MRRQQAKTLLVIEVIMLAITLPKVGSHKVSAQEAGPPVSLPTSVAESESSSPSPQAASVPAASLRAASGATIRFKTQNGEVRDGIPAQAFHVPHLVLYRNGALTGPDERTLSVEVSGIHLPPEGVTVTLTLETQHLNPDKGRGFKKRIPVWRESLRMTNTSGLTQTGITVVFTHMFTETILAGQELIATPTDYFRYEITVADASQPEPSSAPTLSGDHAFLMENQWIVELPAVQEISEGAAPDELIVYYCDMFPFQRNIFDPRSWLPRKDVADYVQTELIPAMLEAYRVQTDEWGFPWHDAWSSYRIGDDLERLSVALTTQSTWFHGVAPRRALSKISINVKGGDHSAYDTLTDGIMSAFHHELFHSLQRNMNLSNGGDGNVGGRRGAWDFFSEGTAVLASSVGQPAVQFTPALEERAFVYRANRFVAGSQILDEDLNTSYAEMSPYHAAIYWRFLYEQCGGMADGVEDPATGMDVISRALNTLYTKDIVDISASTDLVREMPTIMDRALEGSACPFQSYEGSLTAFARAIYALRLKDGRCTGPGIPEGCGFYDRESLYSDPPLSTITYTGTTALYTAADQPLPAGIPSSYGMDFVDVVLDPTADGQALTVEFHGAPGTAADFNVQLWKLKDPGDDATPQPLASPVAAPEALTQVNANGHLFYVIPAIDRAEFNRLGLIITRVDSSESSDPIGEYTIVLHPDAASGQLGVSTNPKIPTTSQSWMSTPGARAWDPWPARPRRSAARRAAV
jgi:hypothetical protein